jgi:hypothetical protein
MSKKGITLLEAKALAKLSTKRLLSYKRSLLQADEVAAFAHPWLYDKRTNGLAKTDPKWIAIYEAVKLELATRPDVKAPKKRS